MSSEIRPVVLLGEGVFHQFHGGICTNVKTQELPKTIELFSKERHVIRGSEKLPRNSPPAVYLGSLPDQARRFI